jgi:hypothetical protein
MSVARKATLRESRSSLAMTSLARSCLHCASAFAGSGRAACLRPRLRCTRRPAARSRRRGSRARCMPRMPPTLHSPVTNHSHVRSHHALYGQGRTMSGWQELKGERNRRSLVRLTRALPLVFPRAVLTRALARPFVPPTPRLAIESYWGAHPIRADRLARALAVRNQVPCGWTWRLGERRSGLPSRSARHLRHTVKSHTHWARDFAACAVNQYIASAGTLTYGAAVQTRTRSGTPPAWLRGNSGMHQVLRSNPCGASKAAAALRVLVSCGGMQKLTTASRCFGLGANTGTFRGRSCSIFGECRTSKSSIAISTLRNARQKRGTGALALTRSF